MRWPTIPAVALSCLASASLAAQPAGSAGPASRQDTAAVQAPSMPEAPRQFQLAATLAIQFWGQAENRGDVDDSPLYGIEIERILNDYLSLRLGGAYGTTSIANDTARTDASQFAVDLALLGRLPLSSRASLGIVPYAGLVGGTIVHDPDEAGLRTRSQTALGLAAGAEVRFADRLGVRIDYRHLFVELEDVFDPENRDATQVGADRIGAGLFWRF